MSTRRGRRGSRKPTRAERELKLANNLAMRQVYEAAVRGRLRDEARHG